MTEISAISFLYQKPAPQFTGKIILPSTTNSIPISEKLTSSSAPAAATTPFDFHDYLKQQKKWILLFFHPIEAASLLEQWKTISNHVDLFDHHSAEIIVCPHNFPSSKQDFHEIKFPILLDDEGNTIAKSYEVFLGKSSQHGEDYVRAVFIVSPEGIIRHISLYDTAVSVRDMEELLSLLIGFQTVDDRGGDGTINQSGHELNEVSFIASSVQRAKSEIKTLSSCYSQALLTQPVLTKSITSGIISALGEIIGSFIYNSRKSIPINDSPPQLGRSMWEVTHRLTVFTLYGLSFTGPFFHWWYGYLHQLVSSWNLSPQLSIILKVLLNQLVMTPPFLLFTIGYLQFFLTFDRQKTVQTLKNSFVSALMMNWKVWTIAQTVNFSIIPTDYQVLFGNLVALWWNIYLSLMSSQAT